MEIDFPEETIDSSEEKFDSSEKKIDFSEEEIDLSKAFKKLFELSLSPQQSFAFNN
jgi:hypothetical protein